VFITCRGNAARESIREIRSKKRPFSPVFAAFSPEIDSLSGENVLFSDNFGLFSEEKGLIS
jgi:hypothetical protein